MVTPTLKRAMVAIRQAKSTRALWIDQLCINQQDDAEVTAQVGIMYHIYNSALRTLIFLDPALMPDTEVNADLTYVRLLRETYLRRTGPHQGPVNKGFEAIFAHPWFARAWILQEVNTAQDVIVHFGAKILKWSDLVYANVYQGAYLASYDRYGCIPSIAIMVSQLTPLGVESQFMVLARLRAYRKWFHRLGIGRLWSPEMTKRRSMLDLLHDSRFCQCANPRDRVFALLSMSTDRAAREGLQDPENDLLTIDYKLPIVTVYTNIAKYILSTTSTLEILCFAEGRHVLPGLPTWVPDWTQQRFYPFQRLPHHFHYSAMFQDMHLAEHVHPLQTAKPRPKPRVSFSSTEKSPDGTHTLKVYGSVLDSVEKVGMPWTKQGGDRDEEVIADWRVLASGDRAEEFAGPIFHKSDLDPATLLHFWYKLGKNRRLNVFDKITVRPDSPPFSYSYRAPAMVPAQHPMRTLWESESEYNFCRYGLRVYLFLSVLAFGITSVGTAFFLGSTLSLCSVGRKLVITKEGYIALVPEDVRVGDIVVFLEGGGCVPFVLRATGEGPEQRYTLIGAGYVHGFMLFGKRWQGAEMRQFEIV